jgi:quercetin dioxygenase-like cupin family protein
VVLPALDRRFGRPLRAAGAGSAISALLLAALLVACGDGSGGGSDPSDRGAGVGALGGSAETETLARMRIAEVQTGELVWTAHEIRLEPGQAIEHRHEPAFVYGRRGEHSLSEAPDGPLGRGERPSRNRGQRVPLDRRERAPLAEGRGAALPAEALHTHAAGDNSAVLWEIRLARPGAPPPLGTQGARRVFESAPLEGIPSPAQASMIEVTVPPRGGRTTVHTHPGPEFIYQLSGRIDYQNAIIGTRRLGPGGAEGIPPNTAVQKRNPYADPASFLSLFLVDPERPFAPKATFDP